MKCNNCDNRATRVTTFYRLKDNGKMSKGSQEAVCEKHYFMFHHGIETITCPDCKKSFMIDFDYFFDMNQIFCAHCGKEIPELED
jgi:hypothetical protein